ncbi:hypothetical protein F2P56_013411 [Juglans regia]|uniref:Uncharacterized protein LOC108992117 n=2 Tax=Juglans regia TaxID=51240 RepID=A0A2I4ERU4_JUGRE|nr:uncharacterized protein LOC108992117 [Juglans regia]KAF5469327.1 hypothetical protein F2P56_013411 [Juglans regia]
MAAYMNLKTSKMKMNLKRKDLELDDFNDDFSDFSLSSPARKIRRLDAELPPIMEEEEAEIPQAQDVVGRLREGLELEFPSNDEKAIVLFKPVNTPLLHSSSSNLSFSVDSHIMSGFKNQLFGSSHYGNVKSVEEQSTKEKNNGCLAVVPWVPSQLPLAPATDVPPLTAEAEGMAVAMDIEEDNNNNSQNANIEQGHPSVHDVYGGIAGSEGLNQWQQQHCLIPQLPQNTSTPITWFR